MPEFAKHVDTIADATSIKFNNRVYEMKQRGEDVIALSFGEAYFDIPFYGFDDLPFPAVYHYSHSRGLAGLRAKLAAYYEKNYAVPVNPDKEIVVTAGSKVAIYMCFLALLNPGDEVLVPEPTWVSYTEHVKLCHAVPVGIPESATVRDYEKYINERTKALVICNPNNPRGYRFTEEDWLFLHAMAEKYGIFILSDEAYSDYVASNNAFISAGAHDPQKRHTIICNSMSKNFGMSGWRLGYAITNEQLLNRVLKLNQHLITCPATILQYYLDKHFDEIIAVTEEQIKAVVRKRAEVTRILDANGLKYLPGDATFYVLVSTDPSKLASYEFSSRLLEEKKVSTVPGIGYGDSCDKFVRISVGNESLERIEQGIKKIKVMIEETSPVAASAR